MTVALITRGMVCIKQVLLQGAPKMTKVQEVEPELKSVTSTPTSGDLRPTIVKIEEQ